MREIQTWPEGREFETLQPMMRITLNAILRTVFGAQGSAFDELRQLFPPMVPLASRMAVMPAALRRDLGPWSPWGRVQRYRRRYDEIIAELISEARADPAFDERNDVLALMLQARYEDGSPISDGHIADELLTLLAAGHETTATTLAWAVERLRRHPRLLSRLTADVDAGGTEMLQATIWEVQRTRPVVEATTRVARERIRLGEWVIPKGHAVIASITLSHGSAQNFADPEVFNPDRFLGTNPDTHTWIPYGGGIRRCIGAAFANMEMNVTLRTLLREFEFGTTYAAGERIHSRGVATAPARGGRAVVYRRKAGSKSTTLSGSERVIGVTHAAGGRRRRPRYRPVLRPDRRPERSADRPHRRPRTAAARLMANRLRHRAGRTRLSRHPIRQPRRRPVHAYGLSAADAARHSARRQPSSAVPPRRHGARHRRSARRARLPGCASGRHLDGRHDRSDDRGALSRPGADADVDHVHHRRTAYRATGAVDVAAVGDRQAAAHTPRGDRARPGDLPPHRIARLSIRRRARSREGEHRLGSRSD